MTEIVDVNAEQLWPPRAAGDRPRLLLCHVRRGSICRATLGILVLMIGLGRAASAAAYKDVLIRGVPHVKQKPGSFTDADYAQHMMELKKKVPRRGFTIVLQRPFVVVSDEAPDKVRRRADKSVKWAVDHLKRAYFSLDPGKIMDVWLFKDKTSYEKHVWEIFRDRTTTPFGYCSEEHNALIMNIATGGGTLVHEIVHAFMDSNFPACPAWFNEGLASLYEQCTVRGGHITGLTNWRLAGLQQVIRAGELPSFDTLVHTTRNEFYRRDPGSNYAQARYLCYYLQETGVLRKFYHGFVKNQQRDPSGWNTLRAVLGEKDMHAFKKKWEAYVLRLRFP